jgi:membrane protease subunit HflC
MGAIIAPLIVIIIGALIVLPQTFFTVDETQVAIVTQFGEFKRQYRTPGLRTKTPFAESVTKFDKRLLRVEAPPASVLTSDKRNLVIDAYARYRIADPLIFFQSLTDERRADSRVGDIVASELRREVAQDLQEEVIGPKREEIMRRVTLASNLFEIDRDAALALPGGLRNGDLTIRVTAEEDGVTTRGRPATQEEIAALEKEAAPEMLGPQGVAYFVPLKNEQGIEIVDVRIKRADFPPDIASSVYARMRAERERIASGLRAEGSQRDAEIRAEVDRDVRILLQDAEGTSAQLRGEAEQQAITVLAEALEEDPEFYEFRRSLEAYKAALAGDTTIFLDPQSDLFKYLQDPSGKFPAAGN